MSLIGNLGLNDESRPDLFQSDPEFERIVRASMPNILADISRREAAEADVAAKRYRGPPAIPRPHEPWKLIEGSLEEKEIRVYTRTFKREHKFWGVKSVGVSMEEFWAEHDPENTRNEDAYDETERTPDFEPEPSESSHLERLSLPTKAAAKPRTSQKTPNANPNHRVKKSKSTTTSSKVEKNTRRSLSSKVDAGHPGLKGQVRQIGGESSQSIADAEASGSQQDPAVKDLGSTTSLRPRDRSAVKAQSTAKDGTSPPRKRPRGRPTIKAKPVTNDEETLLFKRSRGRPSINGKTAESTSKQKTSAVKGDAKIKKASQTERRPSAVSIHKMRTRANGAAEPLQLP